jgi:uncharacterized damage-inducible protein DinB
MSLTAIELLLQLIDEAYEKKAWHGPNLRGSIRGLDVPEAVWRPARGRHNIWEIVVHAAYWKYTVRRRLLGEKRGSFPLQGSNWFPRPEMATADAWRADIALLDDVHGSMRAAVARLSPHDLNVAPPASKVTNLRLITGIAMHDVYHAGQIQVLKRLASSQKRALP